MATATESLHRLEETMSTRASDSRLHQETWAASRAEIQKEEKELMASYFADHDFLLPEGADPAVYARETAASFLTNPGTMPNEVVEKSLGWIGNHAGDGPFHITWYSFGTTVPATLHDFRRNNPHLSAATHVHLFPGTVDIQLQAQISNEALEYAKRLKRRFSYMILSGHSFDLHTGVIRFHFDREIPMQITCASLLATQKFLFLDSKKFTGEGEVGYSLRDLLSTSNSVVLYTVSSSRSEEIKAAFENLCADLLAKAHTGPDLTEQKSLRLTIVGKGDVTTESIPHRGFLRISPPPEVGNSDK